MHMHLLYIPKPLSLTKIEMLIGKERILQCSIGTVQLAKNLGVFGNEIRKLEQQRIPQRIA